MKNLYAFIIAVLIFNNLFSQTKFNLDKSVVKWTGKEITTKIHFGSLKLTSAEINFLGDKITGASFQVDMTSLNVVDLNGRGKSSLEGHLKSDDFFSVEKFNNSSLIVTDSEKKNDGSYVLKGDLSIKGYTHPVEFTLEKISNGFLSKLTFDRSKYDVRFRSGSFFQNLGDKLILDEIELEVTLIY